MIHKDSRKEKLGLIASFSPLLKRTLRNDYYDNKAYYLNSQVADFKNLDSRNEEKESKINKLGTNIHFLNKLDNYICS